MFEVTLFSELPTMTGLPRSAGFSCCSGAKACKCFGARKSVPFTSRDQGFQILEFLRKRPARDASW